MIEPYTDKKDYFGLQMLSNTELSTLVTQATQAGFQVATHAIGDQANRQVLDAYQQVSQTKPSDQLRLRVEHAQILDQKDINRFAPLGIIASVQPTHATSDRPWVPTRIGEHRTKEGAYVWQKLIANQTRIALGSDTPVESANPFWGIYSALTRQNHQGEPKAGWDGDQVLSFDQALAGFTQGGAYASFMEAQLGKLQDGYLADIILLDKNPRTMPVKDWLQIKPILTMVAGKIVYQGKGLNKHIATGLRL